jgi:hypothetical protein
VDLSGSEEVWVARSCEHCDEPSGSGATESLNSIAELKRLIDTVFIWRGLVSRVPNNQAQRPPYVGCPRLIIQCICSYPPHQFTVDRSSA